LQFLSVYLSINLSVSLYSTSFTFSVCLSIYLSFIHLPLFYVIYNFCLSIYLFISLSILHFCLSIYLSFYLLIQNSILYLLLFLSVRHCILPLFLRSSFSPNGSFFNHHLLLSGPDERGSRLRRLSSGHRIFGSLRPLLPHDRRIRHRRRIRLLPPPGGDIIKPFLPLSLTVRKNRTLVVPRNHLPPCLIYEGAYTSGVPQELPTVCSLQPF
jgi:hypothetical protein